MNHSKKVMGFGTFDGLHPGHLFLFDELKKLGNTLTIVVARDENVKKIKGRMPKQNQVQRVKAVKKIKGIDQVIYGNKDDFFKCIRDHQPNIIGLGYDQKTDEEVLKKTFPQIKIIRLKAYFPEKYKSSLMQGAN